MIREQSDWEKELIEEEISKDIEKTFRITHYYDIGNQDIYIERINGNIDARRAAIYCQLWAEKWYQKDDSNAISISNLGIAAMLIMFYGFRHTKNTNLNTTIDMYYHRENACSPNISLLLNDPTLIRHGLREAIFYHIE